jgi:hypothetical protein
MFVVVLDWALTSKVAPGPSTAELSDRGIGAADGRCSDRRTQQGELERVRRASLGTVGPVV